MGFIGHRRQHRRDQFGIGGQGQIFLGPGADRVHCAPRVGADAAGHHRGADALRCQAAHQGADVQHDIAEYQVRAGAAAQAGQRLFDIGRMGDLGAAIHRDLGRRPDLALKSADNE